jgi:translation elongation factor EF-1beta
VETQSEVERDYAAAAASVALAEHRVAFGLAAASVALGLAENEGSNPFGLAAGRTEYRVAFGMAEASVAFGMAALRPDYSVYSFPYLIILLTRHV